MSFLSLTWNEGVFAMRLDFAFFRRKPKAVAPKVMKLKKRVGQKPLPPPFPLPPLKQVVDDGLLDAPALAGTLPTIPSVIVDASLRSHTPDATMLMDDDDDVTHISPLESKKTDLVQQRHEVRKALRGTAR